MADEMCNCAVDDGRVAAHDIAIKVIGKTANGTTVTLQGVGDVGRPDILGQYTVTGDEAKVSADETKLTQAKKSDKDSSTIIKAWSKTGL